MFTIESFLEKVSAEHPGLTDYKTLSVKKELFGALDVQDEFFDSFREDYPVFNTWFNRKSDEEAYTCTSERSLTAFLYVKIEDKTEAYYTINPPFLPRKRLKIGSFKVSLNGYRIGERLIKIVFDNALKQGVEEIYVTIYDKTSEQRRLIELLEEYGFVKYGIKQNHTGNELIYVRSMEKRVNATSSKFTYPFFSKSSRVFLVPIYEEYHTSLFPDSILRTESPSDFFEHKPFRNAINKVYISRSVERDLDTGDIIIFYRTGGLYQGVITTIGVVDNLVKNIRTQEQFIKECRKRSVFSDSELLKHWNYNTRNRPFVVNFLYSYSFPKRPNLKRLIDLGIIRDVKSVPQGFKQISSEQFEQILQETNSNESIIVD